jgi:hypothetical protein
MFGEERNERGEVNMKKYECVLINHHDKIADTIDRYQKQGWHLHTYQATLSDALTSSVNHYLLFEKGDVISPTNN